MQGSAQLTLRLYWQHIKRYKWLFSIIVFTAVVAVCFSLTVPYFLKLFVDILSTRHLSDSVNEALFKLVWFIFLVEIGQWIFWRVNNLVADYVQPRVAANIVNDSFGYLHQHSYDFFNNEFAGSLVKKVNRLAYSFLGLSSKLYWQVIPLVVRMVVIFMVLMWIQPTIGFAMLIWSALYIILSYFFSLYKLKFDLARAAQDSKVSGVLADTITNNINIKLFSTLPFEIKSLKTVTDEWRRRMQVSWSLGTVIEGIQGLLMIGFEVVVLYFSIQFWKKGILTVGDIVWIQAYLLDLFRKLWDFGKMIREAYEELANAEEMTIILHQKHEVKDKAHAKTMRVTEGGIVFKGVQFSYTPNNPVIEGLNLKIEPSEKVALIGPSGGGKSTITKLLMRFYNLESGEILLDGQSIAQVTQDSLRSSISFVPQNPILFHRSLMENIRYGQLNANDEAVFTAAKLAHAHEFIQKFPQKYNTFVGERGVKLSGGERQRIAIARAILSDATILVLDEATSALDSESELLIQEALKNLMKNKTTIVIAHRLSTIMKMDRILVVQEGKIAEEGSHADLIQKNTGLYKKLWDLQVGGYVVN